MRTLVPGLFALILVICIGIPLYPHAQPDIIHFDRFTDEEGLPNNVYTRIIQGHDGFLWMAGQDGLARYDGYTIQTYEHIQKDSTSLSGNNLSDIYEDSKGRLWVATLGSGLNVSNPGKTSFRRVSFQQENPDSLPARVLDITEDSLGHIWLAAVSGLFILHEEDGKFISKSIQEFIDNLPEPSTIGLSTTLFTDVSGNVWIGTTTGMYRYDIDGHQLDRPEHFNGLPSAHIQDISYDRKGNLWVTCQKTGDRIYYASAGDFTFKVFHPITIPSAANEVFLAFDLDNRLWVSAFGDQAYGYDFSDSTLFFQSKVNSDIPHERFFRKPFVDHSGNTWLPVEGFYIYPYPKGFFTYHHPYAFHQSNSCIYGTDSVLWLGYREKGLVRLNRITGKTDYFSREQDGNHHLPVNHLQDVLKVRSGNLILVGFGNVAVMNPRGEIMASFDINGTQRAAFEDSKGRIWIGGFKGLELFSEIKGVLNTYTVPLPKGDSRQFVQTILEDHQGHIWFASDIKGLCMLDPETEEITQFLPNKDDPDALPSITVIDLAIDDQNILWLGTDVGLVRFDPVTAKAKLYGKEEGLQNDYISAVICTADEKIWVSTHSGISVFDPVKIHFVNYNSANGLSNVSYYSRSKFDDGKGTLYFGGKNGVDYFQPARIRRNPTAPKMILTGVTIDNYPARLDADLGKKNQGLQMSYQDKIMEVNMAGVHYNDQKAVRYEYRLDGLSNSWIDIGHRRQVIFSALPPGHYVFRARAYSSDGIASENDLVIPIHVTPPFYQTSWFRISGIALICFLVFGLMKMRERGIKTKQVREAEINRKLAELEKRALQAQMNPHFIYNSMNSIQQFMILHDMEGAMKYLTKFSRILRTVLTISSQNRIPLYDEINLIEDYLQLENMRFPDKFTYSINIDPEINIHTVEIPPFFIQPQVENAIRHGLLRKATPGHLNIELKMKDGHLLVIVEDNGIGREAAMALKQKSGVVEASKALAIVEERLAHMHFDQGYKPFKIIDLYDQHSRPAGTRVEITLPLD